jgi:hypothetical protein
MEMNKYRYYFRHLCGHEVYVSLANSVREARATLGKGYKFIRKERLNVTPRFELAGDRPTAMPVIVSPERSE